MLLIYLRAATLVVMLLQGHMCNLHSSCNENASLSPTGPAQGKRFHETLQPNEHLDWQQWVTSDSQLDQETEM